ncbi:MAG: sel1 repeat family protein [Defluviitaleaceae bacterium]|nr:sel1 repeat family protein [Defluviitaleaceae bacterium]
MAGEISATRWVKYGEAAEHGTDGIEKNLAQAAKCYRNAAEMDDAEGQKELGRCYEKGIGVTQNAEEAVRWYEKAATHKTKPNARAMNNLAHCYQEGIGVEKDLKKAIEWFERAVAENDCSAQLDLGFCCASGMGVVKNENRAFELYKLAASQVDTQDIAIIAMAKNNMGDCYQHGKGVQQNLKEAAEWYRKSAKDGSVWGMTNLAMCYAEGTGIEQNPAKAYELYLQAAELDDSFAQYSVGVCFMLGIGVEKNRDSAMIWFMKAAQQGDENAQYNLGLIGLMPCSVCKVNSLFTNGIGLSFCINDACDNYNALINQNGDVVSGKKCPSCGSNRAVSEAGEKYDGPTGAWICWNSSCDKCGQVDSRF